MNIKITKSLISQLVNIASRDTISQILYEVLQRDERCYNNSNIINLLTDSRFKDVEDFDLNVAKRVLLSKFSNLDSKSNIVEDSIRIESVSNIDFQVNVRYKMADNDYEYSYQLDFADFK